MITDKEISDVAAGLLAHEDVCSVTLFGSAARGESRHGERGRRDPSDLDFLVLVRLEVADTLRLHATLLTKAIERGFLRPLDLVVRRIDTWPSEPVTSLERRILLEGRVFERASEQSSPRAQFPT